MKMKTLQKPKSIKTVEKPEVKFDKLVVTTKIKHFIIRFAYYLVLCSLSFVFIYPFLKMVVTSFMSDSDLVNMTVVWIPTSLQWSNYRIAIEEIHYLSYFSNSVIITGLSTVGHILSCSLVGYGFSRYKFPLKNVLFAVVILSMLVPIQTIIFPMYIQYSKLGILQICRGYLPLIVPCFFGYGLNGAFIIFLFRQFFAGLPKELEDAARIDGCGAFQTFFRIMLPISKSSVLVATVLSVVWHWNDYFEPSIYISRSVNQVLPSRLPVLYNLLSVEDMQEQIEEMGGEFLFNNAMLMAGVFLVVLPLLIVYAFVQKQFMEGIERSGITGT